MADRRAAQIPVQPEQRHQIDRRQRIGGHVVLAAEDNAVNRDVLRRQLALLGCACEVVADGQEALDRLEAGGISLLLTDCHMPVLDGFALTRAIRAAEQRGARVIHGGRMLLHQAARQFELYTGEVAPLLVMGRALDDQIAADPR